MDSGYWLTLDLDSSEVACTGSKSKTLTTGTSIPRVFKIFLLTSTRLTLCVATCSSGIPVFTCCYSTAKVVVLWAGCDPGTGTAPKSGEYSLAEINRQ